MKNTLTKKDIEAIIKASNNYGLSESKIIEHVIVSDNPLYTLIDEINFYKPNAEFIGIIFLLIGKKLKICL